MIIKNGSVFQEDGTFEKKDLYVENGKIVSSIDEVTDKTEIDATGLRSSPRYCRCSQPRSIRTRFFRRRRGRT